MSGGIVMWPLLILSIISLACIFERFIFWINLNKQNNLLINYNLENFEDKKLLSGLDYGLFGYFSTANLRYEFECGHIRRICYSTFSAQSPYIMSIANEYQWYFVC